jgi:hypothetical protein
MFQFLDIIMTLEKMRKKLKDLFVFSDAAQTRLYAFRAFKACIARERELLCALFAHRSLAFRAFHGGCSCAAKITECHDTIIIMSRVS